MGANGYAQEGVSRLIDQSFLYKKSATKVPEAPETDPRELRKLQKLQLLAR